MEPQENFAMNYVYNPSGDDELRCVKIEIEFNNDNGFLEFVVTSDDEIERDDLEVILNRLQEDRFNKIRLSIVHDCEVTLVAADKAYSVVLAATTKTQDELVKPVKWPKQPRSESTMVITSINPK